MTPVPVTPEFQRLISGSRLRLRGRSAFFATLLLHAEFVPSREVAAAGTDGERVYVNPEVAATLAPDVLDGLLLHEVLHAALSHVERRGPREKKRWNKAADLIVNGMVSAAGLPTPPQSRRSTSPRSSCPPNGSRTWRSATTSPNSAPR